MSVMTRWDCTWLPSQLWYRGRSLVQISSLASWTLRGPVDGEGRKRRVRKEKVWIEVEGEGEEVEDGR